MEVEFDLDLAWAVAHGYMPLPAGLLVPFEGNVFNANLDLPPFDHPNLPVPVLCPPAPIEEFGEPEELVVPNFPAECNNLVFDIHVPAENLVQLPGLPAFDVVPDVLPNVVPDPLEEFWANQNDILEDIEDMDPLPPAHFIDNVLNEIGVYAIDIVMSDSESDSENSEDSVICLN